MTAILKSPYSPLVKTDGDVEGNLQDIGIIVAISQRNMTYHPISVTASTPISFAPCPNGTTISPSY